MITIAGQTVSAQSTTAPSGIAIAGARIKHMLAETTSDARGFFLLRIPSDDRSAEVTIIHPDYQDMLVTMRDLMQPGGGLIRMRPR